MKLLSIAALVAVAIVTSGCSGCSTVQTLTSDKAVLQGRKLDEQVMGSADALGITANTVITAAANLRDPATGKPVLTVAQLHTLQKLRSDLDAAHDAAKAAYLAGDATTFTAKLAALTELAKKASTLYAEVSK